MKPVTVDAELRVFHGSEQIGEFIQPASNGKPAIVMWHSASGHYVTSRLATDDEALAWLLKCHLENTDVVLPDEMPLCEYLSSDPNH